MSESVHSLSSFSSHPYHIPPAYSFPKSIRHKYTRSIPGPCDYSPSKRFWSPAFSISKSKRQLSDYRNISPGPGFYNSYFPSSSFSKYSVRKALAKSFEKSNLVINKQGPGRYSPSLTHTTKRSPLYFFGTGSRYPNEKKKSPAPGSYEISLAKKGPAFTISKARKDLSIKKTPGPGDYQIPSTIGIASVMKKIRKISN